MDGEESNRKGMLWNYQWNRSYSWITPRLYITWSIFGRSYHNSKPVLSFIYSPLGVSTSLCPCDMTSIQHQLLCYLFRADPVNSASHCCVRLWHALVSSRALPSTLAVKLNMLNAVLNAEGTEPVFYEPDAGGNALVLQWHFQHFLFYYAVLETTKYNWPGRILSTLVLGYQKRSGRIKAQLLPSRLAIFVVVWG